MTVVEIDSSVKYAGNAANYAGQDEETQLHIHEEDNSDVDVGTNASSRGSLIAAYVAAGLIRRPSHPLF